MTMPVAGTGGAVAISSLNAEGKFSDNSLNVVMEVMATNSEIITIISGKLHVSGISLSDILSITLLTITVIVTVVTAIYELSERRYRLHIRKGGIPLKYIPRPLICTDIPPTYGRITPGTYANMRCTNTTSTSRSNVRVVAAAGGALAIALGITVLVMDVYPDEGISGSIPYLISVMSNLLN